MTLSYQQIQKILEDIEIESSLLISEISHINKRIRDKINRLRFLNLKKRIYNEFLKESKVDFTDNFLTDADVDDISSVL